MSESKLTRGNYKCIRGRIKQTPQYDDIKIKLRNIEKRKDRRWKKTNLVFNQKVTVKELVRLTGRQIDR